MVMSNSRRSWRRGVGTGEPYTEYEIQIQVPNLPQPVTHYLPRPAFSATDLSIVPSRQTNRRVIPFEFVPGEMQNHRTIPRGRSTYSGYIRIVECRMYCSGQRYRRSFSRTDGSIGSLKRDSCFRSFLSWIRNCSVSG